MLSILIPTYNYNVFPLVENLYQQCIASKIVFEIIVFDDASAQHFDNQKINLLENARFEVLEKNIGRSAIRNLLAKTAKYDWLLFLDADVFPMHTNLISNYMNETTSDNKVVYGGIRYQEQKPDKNKLLRWVYGNKREALTAVERQEIEHLSFLTLNFLIHKSVFDKVSFNETIPNLRYEDVLFSFNLEQENIPVIHIENSVYHLGIENSIVFLEKTKESLEGLNYLLKKKMISINYIKLSRYLNILEKTKTKKLIAFLFKKLENVMKKQILSSNPNLFLFDLYRLGYICSL